MNLLATKLLILLAFLAAACRAFNLDNCNDSLQNQTTTFAPFVINVSGELAYTYEGCLHYCGGGVDLNDITTVVQQMTLWFLPYMTLLAQVPFATNNRSGDVMVSLLTLGSPMLAIYSLFVSLFNWMWIRDLSNRNLSRTNDNHLADVLPDVLGRLQQYPITIPDPGLLASTLALSDNREWWKILKDHLRDRARRLDASGTAQLFLAAVVYIFAVVEAFSQPGGMIYSEKV